MNYAIAPDVNNIRALVKKKLYGELSNKKRNLRRTIAHFDLLERSSNTSWTNESAIPANVPRSDESRKPDTMQMEDVNATESDYSEDAREWPDEHKNVIVIRGIEIEEQNAVDESSASSDDDNDDDGDDDDDDDSLPDEDELPEYDDVSTFETVQIHHPDHSHPTMVDNVTDSVGKVSLDAAFEETIYEVTEDD